MMGKIEQGGQCIAIRETRSLVPQIIEECVSATIQRFDTPIGIVGQCGADEVHGILGRFRPEDLSPLTCLDLGEFELSVVGVHGADFFSGGCSEDLDDLNQLVNTGITRKERLAKQQLGPHTALRPNINCRGIIRTPEDQLRRPVIPTANVTDVGLPPHERLGGPEVAQLQLLILWIDQ